MTDEQIVIVEMFRLGAPFGDPNTIIAEDATLDLSAAPAIMQWGFKGKPIGKVLGAWQEGDCVFVKAKLDMQDVLLPPNTEIEFNPGFIVREMRIIDGKRIINAAELTHISMGFKYMPKAQPWWKRLWAWMRGLVAHVKDWLRKRRQTDGKTNPR